MKWPPKIKWPAKKVIKGCDARGDGESPYLTRYEMLRHARGRVWLHFFHRSDADVFHDHPWNFVTVILWRGYVEVTPRGRRRIWPGSILYRPADWVHRVELVDGKPAVTLVFRGIERQWWGFHMPDGWMRFDLYLKKFGCKETGDGDGS